MMRPHYDLKKLPFMARQGEQKYVTDASVVIPPALVITDDEGAVWTLGFDYNEAEWRTGKYEYDVVRNACKTGAFARKIECSINSYGNKVVRIWGAEGWRTWNGRQFV